MTSVFEYQMEFLKIELDQIEGAIRQMDEMTINVKKWAIVTWTLSLGTALATENLNTYIGLTAIIPLVFWIVDAKYRRIQRSFIYRNYQISDFLNDERLNQSIDKQQMVKFCVLDPRALKSHGPDYDNYVSLLSSIRFASVSILYLGLIIISFLIHLMICYFVP